VDWKEALAAAFVKKHEELTEKEFQEKQFLWESKVFFDDVATPGLNAVAVELRKNGRPAELKRLPNGVQLDAPPVLYVVRANARAYGPFIEVELFGRKNRVIRTGLIAENGRSRKLNETTQDHIAEHFVKIYTSYM
jgi:hypothetical protein